MHDLEFHHYANTLVLVWFVILDKMKKSYAHFHISLHLFQVALKLGYHSMKSIGMTKAWALNSSRLSIPPHLQMHEAILL